MTARLAAELAAQGITLIDAPLSRTPAHTWTGEPTTYVGGPAELVEKWRPLLSTWASAVIPVGGPVGSAHAMKLDQQPRRARLRGDLGGVLRDGREDRRRAGGVPRGGLELGDELRQLPELLEVRRSRATRTRTSSRSPTRFKDLSYYSRLATRHRAATLMSDGALQTLKLGMAMGFGERFVPEMVDIVLALNDPPRGD